MDFVDESELNFVAPSQWSKPTQNFSQNLPPPPPPPRPSMYETALVVREEEDGEENNILDAGTSIFFFLFLTHISETNISKHRWIGCDLESNESDEEQCFGSGKGMCRVG